MSDDYEAMIRRTWASRSDESLVRAVAFAEIGRREPAFEKFRGRVEKMDPRAQAVLKTMILERFPSGVPPEKIRQWCPDLPSSMGKP